MDRRDARDERRNGAPTSLLMCSGMLISGLGTTVIGPILPLLMAHWRLVDSQAGLILTAQFVGMSIGSVAISRHLGRSLLMALLLSLTGFGALALAAQSPAGFPVACISLWIAGFGLGQLITTINLLGGERYSSRRGSALSLLNFWWSFGAILSPLLAAWFAPRMSLPLLTGALASCFLLLTVETLREFAGKIAVNRGSSRIAEPRVTGIATSSLFYFAALFFLYGGIEASMNGWLTTYTMRYGKHGLPVSESSALLFWIGLTSGRAISALLLARLTERVLRTGSLWGVVLITGALIFAHSVAAISICAVLIGLCLAPCFPATLSLLLDRSPRPRQAAFALAVTSLGGATLAWLMGQASSHTGSLDMALLLPLGVSIVLLGLSLAAKPPDESLDVA